MAILSGIFTGITFGYTFVHMIKELKRELEERSHNEFRELYGIADDIDDLQLGVQDGKLDAFRHTVSSAVMTALWGSVVADILLDGNELSPGGPGAFRMDLWNNNVGLRIGNQIAVSEIDLADLGVSAPGPNADESEIEEYWLILTLRSWLRPACSYDYLDPGFMQGIDS